MSVHIAEDDALQGSVHGIVIVIVIVFDIRSTSVLRYSAPLREGGPRFLPGCSFCDIRFGVPGLRYVVWRNYVTSVAWPTDGFTDPGLSRWSCLLLILTILRWHGKGFLGLMPLANIDCKHIA